jgi:hypothetical protein
MKTPSVLCFFHLKECWNIVKLGNLEAFNRGIKKGLRKVKGGLN